MKTEEDKKFSVNLIVNQEQEVKKLTPTELQELAKSLVDKEKVNINTDYICVVSVISLSTS
ncbi:hypothetical protein ACPDHQ_16775 [Myroides odoratimimus]|uniref:hypothetical protein n=1 Tax=Myroides odoratimimus TaxID=76832 RepID=UPI003D2F6E71